jgi:hypothetical protein
MDMYAIGSAVLVILIIYYIYYVYIREKLIAHIVSHVSSSCKGEQAITLKYNWISAIFGIPAGVDTTCIGQSTIYY